MRRNRTKHCYYCGGYTRKFDHHCPWIGGCVGEENHCKFWLLLLTHTLQASLAFHIVTPMPVSAIHRSPRGSVTLSSTECLLFWVGLWCSISALQAACSSSSPTCCSATPPPKNCSTGASVNTSKASRAIRLTRDGSRMWHQLSGTARRGSRVIVRQGVGDRPGLQAASPQLPPTPLEQ